MTVCVPTVVLSSEEEDEDEERRTLGTGGCGGGGGGGGVNKSSKVNSGKVQVRKTGARARQER